MVVPMSGPASEKSIFLTALEKESAAERSAYLNQVCAANAAIRAEIEALLAAHDRLDSLPPMPAENFAQTIIRPQTEPLGTSIGPYKLLEQIGEGGFGIVYMADQQAP